MVFVLVCVSGQINFDLFTLLKLARTKRKRKAL